MVRRKLQGSHGALPVQDLRRRVVDPEDVGSLIGAEGVVPLRLRQRHLGVDVLVAPHPVPQIGQVVAVEGQQHRLLRLGEVRRQPPQHGVGVPQPLHVDGEHGLRLRRKGEVRLQLRGDVPLAVLRRGVGHVVLDGGGVVEEIASVGNGALKGLLNEARHVFVRHPAALVLRVRHLVDEAALLGPHPAVDVLPVIEPVVARVEEKSLVALPAVDPEEAVQVPVHRPEGGGGGLGEGPGLHPREDVELRVGGASGEARHHHPASDGVGIGFQSVVVGQGVILRRVGEGRLLREGGEGLVHHEDHVDVFALCGRCFGAVPGRRLGAAVALGLVHGIGGELVAEAVGEAQLVEDRGDVVGVGDGEGVVEPVRGVEGEDQGDEHAKGQGKAQETPPEVPQFRPGEGLHAHKPRRDAHQHGAEGDDGEDLPGPGDGVFPGGGVDLLQEGEVPGEDWLVPDLQLDAVGGGEQGAAGAHQSGGGEDVPEKAGEGQQQKPHRQGVQHDEQGLGAEDGEHAPQAVGLGPEAEQGIKARQKHGADQRPGPGERVFRYVFLQSKVPFCGG